MQPWEAVPPDVFEERADDPGVALCPSCLNPTRWGANFCHTCTCPLTWYAGTGPLERVYAWPWIMAKAMTTPWPRRIHPWGVTLFLGFEVVIWLILFVADELSDGGAFLWPELSAAGPEFAVLATVLIVTLAPLYWIICTIYVVRAWINYLDRRDVDPWAQDADVDA